VLSCKVDRIVTDSVLVLQEICISYLDECQRDRSRHSRLKVLRYFNCLIIIVYPLKVYISVKLMNCLV